MCPIVSINHLTVFGESRLQIIAKYPIGNAKENGQVALLSQRGRAMLR